jgi:hypothetical protein
MRLNFIEIEIDGSTRTNEEKASYNCVTSRSFGEGPKKTRLEAMTSCREMSNSRDVNGGFNMF